MRVLILGGTGFIGRTIAALLPGRDLFNRGRDASMPGLVGDRDTGDYSALRDGSWDAVVDCSAYLPRHVDEAIAALGDRVGRYLFVSSHAVFDGGSTALRPPLTDASLPLTDATYGPSKVACELRVREEYGDRATIVRPGKVAGPYDNQDGLTHWVRAAARGGVVEVPGALTQPVQLVDSRDLAAFVVRLLHDDRGGAWTAVGDTLSLGELVHICADAAGTTVSLREVPLRRAPLVKPPQLWATQHRDPGPARAAGLPVTPLAKTAADVLAGLSGLSG